jgi:sugar/nucleoside kinase (ribokinase family)
VLQISAGGSLSNTLVALSRLGRAEQKVWGRGALRVAMAGVVGADALGEYYAAQLGNAGVDILSEAAPHSCTGGRMRAQHPAVLSLQSCVRFA